PAHRRAVDVRALDAERLDERRGVVGPHLEVVLLLWLLGLPVAALVVVDAAEVLAEDRRGRPEVEVPEAGAVDLDHRLAFTTYLMPQVRTANFNEFAHR